MNWLTLTVLAVFARASYGLSSKILTNTLASSPEMPSILQSVASSLLILVATPLFGGISLDGISDLWLPLLIILLSNSLGTYFYFKGQNRLDVGTTQIAFSSVLVWATLMSILFLGSRFSSAQVMGIVLLLGAIIAAQYRKGSPRPDVGVVYIIISAFMFASVQVASAVVAGGLSLITYLLLVYSGSTLLLSLTGFKNLRLESARLKSRFTTPLIYSILFTSVTVLLYKAFSFLAFAVSPDPGVVVILLTTQSVIAVLLGAIFLRERDYLALKLIAGAIAVFAAVLIKS